MPCAMPCQMPSRWRAVAHRRVHLQQRAEPRIVVGRQRQMMRRRLAGRDVLVRLRGRRSPRRSRCAAHGCARRVCARDARPAARCSAARRSRRARPDARTDRPRRARRAARAAGTRPRNGRRRGGACSCRIDSDALVVLDQQVAGRRAHEHLDAGRARQPLQLADIAGVLARAADPEGEVAMHAVAWRARTLSASAASLVVSGLVFGISKTAVTPPSTAAREPVSRSSLCSSPARGNAPGCR